MSIVIDLIMIALLIGVIMHSIHLSQSLKNFQHLHGEIKPMLKEHTLSLSNSGRYVEQLRSLIRDVNQTLQSKTPEVQLIKQDLEFMTNRANQVADYLEKLLKEARLSGVTHQYLTKEPINDSEFVEELSPESSKMAGKATQEAVIPTTKATVVKRLRQKISPSNGKSLARLKDNKKKAESYSQPTLTKKFVDKVRGKNHAA